MKLILTVFFVFSTSAFASDHITRNEILDDDISLSEYSVKRYGAIGDGQVDDYPSIKRAIDAQINFGKVILYFPSGNYKVGQTIKIVQPKDNLNGGVKFLIQGDGVDSTEVFVANKNLDTFYVEGGLSPNQIQVYLSDLTIGPERKKEDQGWALHVRRAKRSVFKKFAIKGEKCSVKTVEDGAGNTFNFTSGKSGSAYRSNCIRLSD